MATLAVTFAAGTEPGAALRRVASQLEQLAAQMPDRVSTGASTVLTIDNAPTNGTIGVQITAGPYQTSQLITKG